MSKRISNNIKNLWFTREVAGMACGGQKKKNQLNPEEAS